MPFAFVQKTYKIPGFYQWVKPSLAPGAGPFGSTYLQTIVKSIGPGCGGGTGDAKNAVGNFSIGGLAGSGGGYAQVTYLPAALPSLVDIIVGRGSKGAAGASCTGIGLAAASGNAAITPPDHTSFGPIGAFLINSFPGQFNNFGGINQIVTGAGITVNANTRGGSAPSPQTEVLNQTGIDTNSAASPGFTTGTLDGNNSGGVGGCANVTANIRQGFGSAVFGVLGAPSAGGRAFCVLAGPGISQAGVNALPNSGSGGGGSGGAASLADAGSGTIQSGKGGDGSDGMLQTTDIFTLPPVPPSYILEIKLWFHMNNMARPISLTGRYKS